MQIHMHTSVWEFHQSYIRRLCEGYDVTMVIFREKNCRVDLHGSLSKEGRSERYKDMRLFMPTCVLERRMILSANASEFIRVLLIRASMKLGRRLNNSSRTRLKRIRESGSPCLTPRSKQML